MTSASMFAPCVQVEGKTEAQVRLESKDAKKGLPVVHDVSPSKFITLGLDLEDKQHQIRVQAVLKKAGTTGQEIDLKRMCTKLNHRVTQFRRLQSTYTPASCTTCQIRVQAVLKKAGTTGQEIDLKGMRTKLNHCVTQFRRLQSTYTPAALQILGDMDIPEAQMIENMPLLLPSALSLANQVRHQGASTRTCTIPRNESKIGLHLEKYQIPWETIRLLGDGNPDKVGWQVLKKDNIRCMEDTEDLAKKAQHRENPVARLRKQNTELLPHGLLPAEMDEGMDEEDELTDWTTGTDTEIQAALRIEWLKVYVRTCRWKEEVELLEAEYERVLISFEYEAKHWDARGTAVHVGIIPREQAHLRNGKRQCSASWANEGVSTSAKRERFGRHADEASAMDDDKGDDAREEEERQQEEREILREEVDVNDDEYILSGAVED
ncbi:hypothetical protein B0H16DRAFT_1469541 [Mycena metata]|uniref:Uncharacterized protein n=1 Tax=Mycena metata TaxID=1033252 RepID=A0AAD7MS07_9AGAR|nr:hypothetical protein B0H16DRAFT_1469541 [Mycena metata]